jgi:uncharacterized protein
MRLPSPRVLAAALVLVACFLALLPCKSSAEDLSKITPSGYVTDLAGTLSPASKLNLESLCTELEQKTGAQMAIVTIHSLDGQTVEYYAVDLFKKLGVGNKKDDTGVLLLVVPDEHKYRIEVGYGLEPIINDARAGDAGRAMVPFLRAGNYDSAIQTAAWQLAKYIADDKGVTLTGQPLVRAAPHSNDDNGSGFGALAVLAIIVIYLVIAGISRGKRGGGGGGLIWFILGMLLGGSGRGGGGFSGGGGFGGGSSGGGGGDSGGGFGGFGGGSSGGGGASGDW